MKQTNKSGKIIVNKGNFSNRIWINIQENPCFIYILNVYLNGQGKIYIAFISKQDIKFVDGGLQYQTKFDFCIS